MTLTVEICTKKVQQEEKKAQFSLTDIDRNTVFSTIHFLTSEAVEVAFKRPQNCVSN